MGPVLLFVLFGFGLFFSVVGADPEDYSLQDVVYFAAVVSIVLIVQLLLAYGLNKLTVAILPDVTRRKNIFVWLLTVFVLCNSYFFAFVTVPLPRMVKLVVGLLIAGIYLSSTSIQALRKPIAVFMSALMIIAGYQLGWQTWTAESDLSKLNAVDSTVTEHKITDRRNIYILLFDALAGETALRVLFKTTQAPHYSYLRASGFRVFDGVAPYHHTLASLARMLANRPLPAKAAALRRVIGGEVPVPSYEVLRNNGYLIQLIFHSRYIMGETRGIDYVTPLAQSFEPGTCDFLSPRYLYFGCRSVFWKQLDRSLSRTVKLDLDSHIELATKRLERASGDSRPWFTLVYLRQPKHTPQGFSLGDKDRAARFVESYKEDLKSVAETFKIFVDTIRKSDPHGIIVVAGDHGAWLTRYMDWDDSPYTYLDRYGIGIGISPADFCADRLAEGVTTYNLTRDIIACLSDGREPFGDPRNSQPMPSDLTKALKAINKQTN